MSRPPPPATEPFWEGPFQSPLTGRTEFRDVIRLCQDGSTDRPRPLAAPAPGAARGSPGWGPQAARGVPEPSWEYRLPRDHRGTAQTADFPSGRLLRGAAAAAGRWAEGADGPLAPGLPGAGAAASGPSGWATASG